MSVQFIKNLYFIFETQDRLKQIIKKQNTRLLMLKLKQRKRKLEKEETNEMGLTRACNE